MRPTCGRTTDFFGVGGRLSLTPRFSEVGVARVLTAFKGNGSNERGIPSVTTFLPRLFK